MIAVTQHCPLLTSFGLAYVQLSDDVLTQLTLLCSNMQYIDISNNDMVAENLHNLCRISISNCKRLTDACLEHLTQNNASTLQVLRATGFLTMRVDVLVSLLQKCVHLRTLSLDCYIDAYHTDVIPHMRNLETLITYSQLSDDVLCTIAKYCKKLQQLAIFSFDGIPVPQINSTDETQVMYCASEQTES